MINLIRSEIQGGKVMELHYIYISICIFTFLLNITLTCHIISKTRTLSTETSYSDCNTLTFYLPGKSKSHEEKTVTQVTDDTVVL